MDAELPSGVTPAPTSPPLRVLFVDDERAVLDGLKDLLRKERRRWLLSFAEGPQAGLEAVDAGPFDIVFSDLRMAPVDGAAFLAAVQQRCPSAIRVVLSGSSEKAAALRAATVAHQFLAKPYDGEALRVMLNRAEALKRTVADERVRAWVGGLQALPSIPSTYLDLSYVASNPRASTDDFVRVVERDPAMCSKVLQLVNSAYFGVAQTVVSVKQAVTFLGTETVKTLAISAHVFAVPEPNVPGFSAAGLQANALRTAGLAKRLAGAERDAAFTAAMLCDIGQLVIARAEPSGFGAALRQAQDEGTPLHVHEAAHCGATHMAVGAYLLGVWGLPEALVRVVAGHHEPSTVGEGSDQVLAAVHVATAALAGAPTDEVPQGLDLEFLARSGHAASLPGWLAQAKAARAAPRRAA